MASWALQAGPRPQTATPPTLQAKQRVLEVVSELERTSPFRPDAPGAAPSLLGDWALAFASDGTVVTRSAPAQLLAALSALPGVGISNIRQELDAPAPGAQGACLRAYERLSLAGCPCIAQAAGRCKVPRSRVHGQMANKLRCAVKQSLL